MNRRVSTADDFRQAFLRSLIEVEIPECGVIKVRNPKYGPSKSEISLLVEQGNAREFCAKLISELIESPSISWNEVQKWDDQSIQKAIRAWIEKANKDKLSLPEDREFFVAFQQAYSGYVTHHVQERVQLMRPFLQKLKTYFDNFNKGIYELVEAMLKNEQAIEGEVKFINQRKNELWGYLPEFSEDVVLIDEDLPDISYFINANPVSESFNNIEFLPELLKQTQAKEFSLSLKTFFQKSSYLKERWRIVEQALLAHNDENYIVSIPLLLAQIEGIYTEAITIKRFVTRSENAFYANDFEGKMKHHQDGKPIKILGLKQKVNQAKYINKSLKDPIVDTTSTIVNHFFQSRDDILHGTNLTYDSPQYSLKLILTIYLLAEMFSHFESDIS